MELTLLSDELGGGGMDFDLSAVYGGRLPAGFISKNEFYLKTIASVYKDKKMALLLGSGISRQSGIPDWRGLVEEMYRRYLAHRLGCFENDVKELREELIRADLSKSNILPFIKNKELIEIAQYIKPSTPDKIEEDSTQALCARLVQSIFKERYGEKVAQCAQNDVIFGDKDKNGNETLFELAQLICPQEGGSPFINYVATYNYDDLLEGALHNGGFNHKLNVIMLANGKVHKRFSVNGASADNDSVYIYHVHGVTPVLYSELKCGPIVLNDESYRELESDAFLWGNNLQVQLYKEHPTLIIGFSCEDRNFRRLCSIKSCKGSFKPRFALMQAKEYFNGVEELGKEAKGPVEKINREKQIAAATILNIYESYLFEQYGIHVIWVYDAAVHVKRVVRRLREIAAEL